MKAAAAHITQREVFFSLCFRLFHICCVYVCVCVLTNRERIRYFNLHANQETTGQTLKTLIVPPFLLTLARLRETKAATSFVGRERGESAEFQPYRKLRAFLSLSLVAVVAETRNVHIANDLGVVNI